MILVAICASAIGGSRLGNLKIWTILGCIASASALTAIASTGMFAAGAGPLRAAIFALGLGNGVYAAAAIGSMMALAVKGAPKREGTRMGLWGAAQALAMGAGGVVATALVDLARSYLGSPLYAYSFVFAVEALAFLASAVLAAGIGASSPAPESASRSSVRVAPQTP
jgi:BCD family chlorophyll transporter-like MFS transporter